MFDIGQLEGGLNLRQFHKKVIPDWTVCNLPVDQVKLGAHIEIY